MSDQASGKPVLEIPLNTEAWDSFLEKFKGYKADLADQPHAWGQVNEILHALVGEMDTLAASVSELEDFDGTKINNFFVVAGKQSEHIEKSSKATAGFWKATTKDLEKSTKFMSEIARGGFSLSALGLTGIPLGIAGIVAGAAGAAIGSSDSIAEKNKVGRSLGLATGAEQDFSANFDKFGLGAADLRNVANAQGDVSKWTPFRAAGISVDEIRNLDPEKLLQTFDERASKQVAQWQKQGLPWATMANTFGYTDILSQDQLRIGASYARDNPEAFAQAQSKYEKDLPQTTIDQKAADAASDEMAKLRADWAKDVNAMETVLSGLTPEVSKVTDKFTDLVVAFAKSDTLKHAIDDVASAFDWLDQKVSWINKINDDPKNHPEQPYGDAVSQWADDHWGIVKHNLGVYRDLIFGKPTDNPDANSSFDDLEKANDLPHGLLANIERQESSNNTDPKLKTQSNNTPGPAGAFQIDRPTALAWGVADRMSEADSAKGAAKGLHDLMQRYHGDLAAAIAKYDGFTGLDADIAKYGPKWRDHLSEFGSDKAVKETSNYLASMEKHGADLSYHGDSNQQNIAAEVAKRMRQGPVAEQKPSAVLPQFHLPAGMQQNNYGQMAPLKVDVSVTVPVGSNVITSVGGLAP